MTQLTILQPAGATTTGTPGSTQSNGAADGANPFEQLLSGLLASGQVAPQGTIQLAAGTAGTLSAVAANGGAAGKTAVSAAGLLASTIGKQTAASMAEAGGAAPNSGTALTGANVLGIDGVLPTVGRGEQVQSKTGSQPLPSSTGASTTPITAALSKIKSSTVQGIPAAVTGKTATPAVPTPGGASAPANKAATTLTSATKGQSPAGAQNPQSATTLAGGSAVTAALNEKNAAPGDSVRKKASPTVVSGEVANAKVTIKAAVIDAPGARKKAEKAAAKNDSSATRAVKSKASARSTPQAPNGPTVAQAAQAATKANAAAPPPPTANAQPLDPFGPAPGSAVTVGSDGVTLVSVSSVTTSAGAESVTQNTAARAAAPPVPVPQQIAVQFSQALTEGAGRMSIQLQPESLGRIEVEIELTKDGKLSAAFVADRPDTLDMLQRDARALERALNDAGIRTDTGGLSFSLRGESGQSQQFSNSQSGSGGGGEFGGIKGDDIPTPRAPILNVNALLDIQV